MKKIFILIMIASLFTFMSCKSSDVKSADEAQPKLVALTFDDGPNEEMTNLVLDKLEKHGVVASFYLIGQLVDEYTQPVLQRMVAMGCELNNHSWGWDSLDSKSPEEIQESVKNTSEAIKKYAGVEPKFFRPPNLATSEELFKYAGLPCTSGVLAMDWAGCGTDAKARAQNVLNSVRDGAIILMHDVQPYPHPTPEALDILIPKLKKQGYEFVTVSELFARKGVSPDPTEEILWVYVQ